MNYTNLFWAVLLLYPFTLGGRIIAWSIRSLSAHEKFVTDYLDCPTCEKGVKFGCQNSGMELDRFCSFASGLIALFAILGWGISSKAIVGWLLTAICITIVVIDYRYIIVPDCISVGGCKLGLAYGLGCSAASFHSPDLQLGIGIIESLLGLVLIGGGLIFAEAILFRYFEREIIGGGDIKLFACFGSFLGYKRALIILAFSTTIIILNGIGKLILQKSFLYFASPFGHLIPSPIYSCFAFLIVFWFEIYELQVPQIFTYIFPLLIFFLLIWRLQCFTYGVKEFRKLEET